jgi:thioredoxin
MKEITSNKEFNEVIQQDKPVLLDFYADWCGPCQQLMPTVEKVAEAYEGKVEVRKINIDKNQAIAAKFNVRSIPTLFFVKDAQIRHRINGMTSNVTIKKNLDKLLK